MENTDSLTALFGQVIERRKNDGAYRAAVAKGLEESTEHMAYGHVLPYVENRNAKTAALRAAALIATARDVPHTPGKPLGKSLRELTMARNGGKSPDPDPGKRDVVATRLRGFADQDLEEASATLRRLLALAGGTKVGFDFQVLARTLVRWGHGNTAASQAVRLRTIEDYYGGWDSSTPSNSNTNEPKENHA